MKKKILISIFVIISLNMFSQVTPPDPALRPGPGLPINQGQLLLLGAAIFYAVNKIRKNT